MGIKSLSLAAGFFIACLPGMALSAGQYSVEYYKSHPEETRLRAQYCNDLVARALTGGDFNDYRRWQSDPDCKNARAALRFLDTVAKQAAEEREIAQLADLPYEERYRLYKELNTLEANVRKNTRHKRDMLIRANQRLRKNWLQKFRDNPELLDAQVSQCDPVINERLRTIYLDVDTPGECQAVEDYQREIGVKKTPRPFWEVLPFVSSTKEKEH